MSDLAFIHLVPPIGFVVVLVAVLAQSRLMDLLVVKPPPGPRAGQPGQRKAYASGEDVADHRAQPDFSQFFHFAIFFTLMHVLALVVATVPRGSPSGAALAVGFLACAAVSLVVLFRR
jgi:NADH-quinone oxidoreductase subunit A